MKSFKQFIYRTVRQVERRWRFARPGSVLILVVALLVLMALIGTAYISTTRIDRYNSRQNIANTQVDLLVDGVVDLVVGTIRGDLYDSNGYRIAPAVPSVANISDPYDHWDGVGQVLPSQNIQDLSLTGSIYPFQDAHDPWLGARIPRPVWPFFPMSMAPTGTGYTNNPPIWDSISYPPLRAAMTPGRPWRVDTPFVPAGYFSSYDLGVRKFWFEPTRIEVPVGSGIYYPAFYIRQPVTGNVMDIVEPSRSLSLNAPPGQLPFIAADTDGDGIADAGYFKLPMGQIDGITYYAAIRVIDNNSAINVNTAYSRDYDFAASGASIPATPNLGYFPGSVGLLEMLRTWDPAAVSMATNINRVENAALPVTPGTVASPKQRDFRQLSLFRMQRSAAAPPGLYGPPLTDTTGAPIPDYSYRSATEAQYMQLARRLDNPGLNYGGAPLSPYQAFSDSDGIGLAYKFCLVNSAASPTQLEQRLLMSLRTFGPADTAVRSTPYDPTPGLAGGVFTWCNENFYCEPENYSSSTQVYNTFRPKRAFMVAHNPVSNQAPHRDINKLISPIGALPAPAPNVADSASPPSPERMPANRPDMPKASLNTATFGELWRAYWLAMSEGDGTITPFDDQINRALAADLEDPYRGHAHNGSAPLTAPASNYTSAGYAAAPASCYPPVNWNPARTFRSSIRATPPYAGLPRLSALHQLLLRAALAAVNTEDLRDADDDCTAHEIPLQVTAGAASGAATTAVNVVVYGTERQPYITEVYANNDNHDVPGYGINVNGYVAVELYNPYPVPIDLTAGRYALATIDRTATAPGAPYRTLTPIADFSNPLDAALENATPGNIVIPANGYLVMENFPPAGVGTVTPGSASYRPGGTQLPAVGFVTSPSAVVYAYVPGLLDGTRTVFDRELVLLRPRRADGAFSSGSYAFSGTTYDDNPTSNPDRLAGAMRDMVPLDSYDFTGLTAIAAPPTAAVAASWHYVRQTVTPTLVPSWTFVYPGRYDANLPAGTPRQCGTQTTGSLVAPYVAGTNEPWDPTVPPGTPPTPPPSLGQNIVAGVPTASPVDNPASGYTPVFPVQVANMRYPAPFQTAIPAPGAGNQYPFGGFARNGDALHVPFIGAYRITSTDTTVPLPRLLELNPITADSVFAEDTDLDDDPGQAGETGEEDREQLGRFCPLRVLPPATANPENVPDFATYTPGGMTVSPGIVINDYAQDPSYLATVPPTLSGYVNGFNWQPYWRYRWGMDLFDYVTVQAPNNDYSVDYPNQKPWQPNTQYQLNDVVTYYGRLYRTTAHTSPATAPSPATYTTGAAPEAGTTLAPLTRDALLNGIGTAGRPNATPDESAEDTVPVEGLVNINTASWRVLAALPLVVDPATSVVDRDATKALAQAIVYYRDIDCGTVAGITIPHGPFRSIWELNRVIDRRPAGPLAPGATPAKNFRNNMGTYTPWVAGSAEPNVYFGDITPGGPVTPPAAVGSTDGVRNDYEERYAQLIRLSNLLTTRSDTFTAYILVQGWRDAETDHPSLIVQRRVAYILDRSRVTATNSQVKKTVVPNN